MPGGKFASRADGAVGAIAGIGINNVRAIGAENLLTFGGDILRHAECDGKSFSSAEHGIGDAGVAAGGIEQNLAVAELATATAFGDDAGGGAIFHRSAGIVPFGLAQKCDAGKMRSELVKAQQRSVADAVEQALSGARSGGFRRMKRRESCRQPG